MLLPLLVSGYPQHGADAAVVKGNEPIQVFAHWGPALTSVEEYRNHTDLVRFFLGGIGESVICEHSAMYVKLQMLCWHCQCDGLLLRPPFHWMRPVSQDKL